MAALDLEIKHESVTAALARVARAVTDMTPLMQDLGELLVAQTDERFREGRAPDGTAWAPRSPVTLAAYARRGDKPGPRPLIGTSRRLSTTIHYRAGSADVEVGSSAVQAAVMQFGAAQGQFGARMGRTRPTEKQPKSRNYFMHLPWGDIPARPFLGLSDDNLQDVRDEIDAWLTKAVRGA